MVVRSPIKILIALVIFCTLYSCLGYNSPDAKTYNWVGERKFNSDQPRPWTWDGDLDKLLSWTPESDSDRDFNRGTVKLAAKFTNSDYWVNKNAKDKGLVSIVGPWWPSQNTPTYVSQGSDHFRIQSFTWWQYNDIYIMFNNWHYLPSVEIIDAAHRNGVKVYSLIMNPDTISVKALVRKEGDKYPAADKLIEIAQYYLFDGWFLNFETDGTEKLATEVAKFLIYFNKASEGTGVRLMWYDSWIKTGKVKYQNAINEKNSIFMQYENQPAAHEYFINYWYKYEELQNTKSLVESFGRNKWDVHIGFETWQNYFGAGGDVWDTDVLEAPHFMSLSCFQMNGMIDVARNNEDFYLWGEKFYSGNNHDPSYTMSEKNWKGLAHYYPAKSVIKGDEFITTFNTGHGKFFTVNGKIKRVNEWNNRAIQDIPPTWRWVVESDSNKLFPKFDFDEAYYGGNSLKIKGVLNCDNLLKLYMTDLEINDNSVFDLVYKSKVDPNMQIALSFTDKPDYWELIPFEHPNSESWNNLAIDLSGYEGKIVGAIGLWFNGKTNDSNYVVNIGKFGIRNYNENKISRPKYISVIELGKREGEFSVKLNWDKVEAARFYNIYKVLNDEYELIGFSTSNFYYIPSVKIAEDIEKIELAVEAVSTNYLHSDKTKTKISFD